MSRVKRSVHGRKKRRETLARAKGYRGQASKSYKRAKEALLKADSYAYRDRRNKKREFRALWIAQFVANTGTWAQTVGAQWLMGDLGGSALQIALVQTAATLPVFLLVIPAGALGDILDRRRLLLLSQTLMLLASGLMVLWVSRHRRSPFTWACAALAAGFALLFVLRDADWILVLGLLTSAVLLAPTLGPLGTVLLVAGLGIVTELVVARNYGLALLFITPMAMLMGQLADPRRYRAAMERVSGPVLLVHGDLDRLIPVQAARDVARRHPAWRYVELEGIGHVPQLQCPERLAEEVLPWLAEVGAVPTGR